MFRIARVFFSQSKILNKMLTLHTLKNRSQFITFGKRAHICFIRDERAKFVKLDLSVTGTISCWNSMISTIIQNHWNG